MHARMRRAAVVAAALCARLVAAAPACAAQPDCNGPRGARQQDLHPGVHVRRVHRLRHRRRDAGAARRRCSPSCATRATATSSCSRSAACRPSGCARCSTSTGIKASARHVDVGTPALPAEPRPDPRGEPRSSASRTSAPAPTPRNYTTEAQWIGLRRVPRRARRAGPQGRPDADDPQPQLGVRDLVRRTTPTTILLAHTDPRNVVFQVDLYWSTRGLGTAEGATSVAQADDLSAELVRRLGNRAQLFHVKDMATTGRRSRAGSRSSGAGGSTSRRSSPRARDR